MLLFQEQGLGIPDFFQGKRSGHNRFYRTLLNALNQIIEHFRFKNGASQKAEIFQIQCPDIQLNKGAGNGTRHCITTTGTQNFHLVMS